MIANSCYRFDVSLSIEKCRDKKIAAALTGSSRDANNREVRREYFRRAFTGAFRWKDCM